MSKICYLTFIILFISCSYNKELGSRETLFDTKEYYNKESFEKKIYLDSLNKLSNKIINDSTNRNFLFELSTQYYYLNQFQKSLEVNKKNLIFSIEARDSLGIAMSYYYIGDCYEINKKDSAYYYYQKAEKLYRLLTKNELVGKMLFNKAYILFFEGNYIESEIMISNSLKLLNKSNDKQLIFSCYNLIGINFEKLEEYEESLKYYLLAKDFLNGALHDKDDFDKKNNYKITLAVNIANIYEKQSQFENAKQELESILTPELNEQWPNQYSAQASAWSKRRK